MIENRITAKVKPVFKAAKTLHQTFSKIPFDIEYNQMTTLVLHRNLELPL